MKIQIVLIVCLVLRFIGCGDSNEHAVFRSKDMITIYWVLEDNEEINNFELSNNILEFDIKMGELHEKQSLPIKFAANHETLEIKGMSRLDDLAIFHIMVTSMTRSHGIYKTYTTYRGSDIGGDYELGDFTKAKTFRTGDRITMFWHRPDKPEKKWYKWTHAEGTTFGGEPRSDHWTEELSITGVEPHESINAIYIDSTPEIFIVYFRVLPNPTE